MPGAWYATEKLVECWRDQEAIYVIGGAVWDEGDPRNAALQESHGVDAAAFFWKVIVATGEGGTVRRHIAFWIPNLAEATSANTESYVVNVGTLQEKLASYSQAETFSLPLDTATSTMWDEWKIVSGSCDYSR